MFPDMKVHLRTCEYLNTSHLSSPTCEDLGIPRDETIQTKCIRNASFHTERLRHEAIEKKDPFSPLSIIPVPGHFGFGILETTFIRKRNERERDRVRCVNEGYSRLKQHLPLRNKDKRISKVETLRTAIEYIRHLQALLKDDNASKNSFQCGISPPGGVDSGIQTSFQCEINARCEVKSESADDSEIDSSDGEPKYGTRDSVFSSDDEAFT